MDNHKRIFVTSAAAAADDDDLITNFTDDLIDKILERLPIKDAVRTSILSKKWRYRWTTMKTLAFHPQFAGKTFSELEPFAHNGFIRIVNQIMVQHNGPITKVYLHIPEMYLDSFQEVDQWMLILSRKGVRELVIMNEYWVYRIPSSVFSCVELRELGLFNCIFKSPLEFQGFSYLEDIFFTRVDFGGGFGGNVINLPQLKKLIVHTCENVSNFNIKAVKLQTLWIVRCPDAVVLRFLHSECLDEVRVSLKSLEDSLPVERFSLETMLSHLPNIVCFIIDGYFLKFLAVEKFPKWLPNAVKCLKKLELQTFSFGDLDQLQGALCLLQSSPNLKDLRMTRLQMEPGDDLELTSNYLESIDCLHDQTLFWLRSVKMTSLEGSRPELLFIKLVLDHTTHLENMIIRPTATADVEKRLDIAKDVMLFPRASPKAKLVYLDPEP